MAQAATVFCLMCLFLAAAYGYQEQSGNPLPSPQDGEDYDPLAPPQDAEGYYLLSTKEDFRWFISRDRDSYTNVT